jgi:hypothetical protein
MLLQFSVSQALDNVDSTISIRNYSLGSLNDNAVAVNVELPTVENPRKENTLFSLSLEFAPACSSEGTETQGLIQLSTASVRGNGASEYAGDIGGVLDGMNKYFAAKDNCDESFKFAYHRQRFGAVYVGDAIGKGTVDSALQAVNRRVSSNAILTSRTVGECLLRHSVST